VLTSGEPHLLLYDVFALNLYVSLDTEFMADYREAYDATLGKALPVLSLVKSLFGRSTHIHEFGFSPFKCGMTQAGRLIDHRRRGRMIQGMVDALSSLPIDLLGLYVLHNGVAANDTDVQYMYGLRRSDGATKYATMQEFGYGRGVVVAGPFIETE
jgi:hypothetical protein